MPLCVPVLQRQLTSALQKWDECITQLEACAKMVASKFPYLLLLGSGRKLQGIPSDPVAFSNAVIHDCLCHVRAIQKCLASTRANQVGWWLSECFSTAVAA